MHLRLFIEYILFKLENNVFLGRKTIFSFATSCNFKTYAVDCSFPTCNLVFTSYSIEILMLTNKKAIKHA